MVVQLMPPTNSTPAPEAVIAEAEEVISLWEARKVTQPFDGFTGLVRICDSERKEEAGIVFPKAGQQASSSTLQGTGPSAAAAAAAATTTASTPTAAPTQTASTMSQPVENGQGEQQLPASSTDPLIDQLAMAELLEGADSGAGDDGWVQQYLLTGETEDQQAPAGPAATTSQPPSATTTQPPREERKEMQQLHQPDAGSPSPAGAAHPRTGVAPPVARPGGHTPSVPGRQAGQPVTAAMLQRAIMRKAVQAARIEAHNQLDWVDDLPSAPSTPVPPKPPRNP